MKIIFVSPFFYPIDGGMEKHVLYLAEELVKKGHEVKVFTSNLSRTGKIETQEETYKGIKIKRFKSWFKIGDFGSFFPSVFKAVRKEKPDILHLHAYRHPHNLLVFLFNNTIITPHYPNYPKGLRKKWLDFSIMLFDKTVGRLILKKAKKIIAVSKPEIDWLKEKFNIEDKNIKLIPNGIPKEQLIIRNRNIFREKHNIRSLLILYFGRIHKSKGIDQIIKVAKYFPKERFVVMGNGPDLENLKNLIKELKLTNVRFIYGKITDEDKLQAFSAADIFVHPSHYDAFGITVLEAFSQKCAVITTDQGGLPWVIDKAGLVFKDNDSNDLKEKLSYLINNKKVRLELQNKGYKRAKDFTWEEISKKLEKTYKEVLE